MKIIKIHYKISKPVSNYKEIKAVAEEMKRFIVVGKFEGFYNKAFAIAHCQVSETPMSFFIVAPDCVNEGMFKGQVIINPQIISAPLQKNIAVYPEAVKKLGLDPEKIKGKPVNIPNAIEYLEPCMSFLFRRPKKIIRYDEIHVRYQIPSFFGLKTITADLVGIASEIFQHEYDHTQGKNIYFESETPVKWWELIGTPKSKGGTSLDNPDELGLFQSKEISIKYPRQCGKCGHWQSSKFDPRCEHQAQIDNG